MISDKILAAYVAKRRKQQRKGRGRMTTINLKSALVDGDGAELKEGDSSVYVGTILKRCLLMPDGQKDDEKTTDDEKCRAWALILEINQAMKDSEAMRSFEAADVTFMAKQLKRAFNSPLVIGQIKPLLK